MRTTELIILFIAFISAVLAVHCFCLMNDNYNKLMQQAVDRGHAEWRIIPGTSNTEFKWKD